MKTKTFLLFLLLMATCLVGSNVFCSCSKDDVEDTPPAGSNTTDNKDTHEYVDLGLPSGTLWATCNVGAKSPEEYGDYFAWGETEPKTNYSWETYKYCKGTNNTITKYCAQYGPVDYKVELEPSDDAATVNWGSEWQMPSSEQCAELSNYRYTTTTWTTLNGVEGARITSKSNGNSIFLPAAGFRSETRLRYAGDSGEFWSRSVHSGDINYARGLIVEFGDSDTYLNYRHLGLSVRPVRVKESIAVSNIELNKTELSVKAGESTRLSATVLPADATNKAVVCESSSADVATVDETGKVTAIAGGICAIICSATDGSGVKAECEITVYADNEDNSGAIDGRDYVDLGLPSGTLWATCNVGANSPEEYGDYFAWGETQPKTDNNYSLGAYRYYDSVNKVYTKYCTDSYYGTIDNKKELEMSDDAATANWGSGWQMPSYGQIEELIKSSYTTITWTTLNGVNGRMIVSKSNGNRIFLPAAGYRLGTGLRSAGSNGYYWSRSLSTGGGDYAYSLYFGSGDIYASYDGRYYGQSVRPVRVKN